MIIDTSFFHPHYYKNCPQKFTTVKRDVKAVYPQLYKNSESVKDDRFDDHSWNRVHACALRSFTLWTIKPTDSKIELIFRKVIFIAGSHIAVIFDVVVNTMLSVPKLVIIGASYVMRGINNVVSWKKEHTDIFGLIEDPNTAHFFTTLGETYLNIPMNIVNVFFATVQLFVDIGPKLSRQYEWSYWIYEIEDVSENLSYCKTKGSSNDQKPRLILDQNKVKFLRDKCGWKGVSDEKLLSWNQPYNQYQNEDGGLFKNRARLIFIQDQDSPFIASEWVEWKKVGQSGNTNYWKSFFCTENSEY